MAMVVATVALLEPAIASADIGRGRPGTRATCLYPPVVGPVLDPFRRPPCPYCAGHRGVTYDTVPGSAVRAMAAGEVVYAGSVAGTRYVVVRHADGRRATYGRLIAIAVAVGRQVTAGDVVGTAGETVHVGIRVGDDYLDPVPLIGSLRGRARLVPLTGTVRPANRRSQPVCPAAQVGGVAGRLR